MFFTPSFLSETRFAPRLPIKDLAVLDWTRKADFPSNCASTHFVLLLHRTKPTCCCRAELFLCFFPFLLLRGSCGACHFLWISRLWSFLLIALHSFHPVCTIISSLDDPALHSRLFLMWTTQEGFRLVNTSFSSRPFSQSDVPSQACWANERWRDINLIAVRDRYIDRGGCNKLRRDCWLPVRLAFQRTSRFTHWFYWTKSHVWGHQLYIWF